VTTGFLIYTFSLFVVPMSELLDAPRTSIAIASSIYTACVAIFSPMVGNQIAKGRAKLLVLVGAALFGGGFALQSFASSLPMFYIFYALVGIGCALAGPVMSSALPTAWFAKKRGLAVGLANCGGGVAAIFVPSLVAGLTQTAGVNVAYLVLGAAAAILLAIAALLIKSKPQDIGLLPDGMTAEQCEAMPAGKRPAADGLTRAQALRTPALWLLSAALITLGFAQLGVMQNAAAFLNDLKFDPQTAATALGAIGIASTVSKVFFGWLADRIDAKLVFSVGNILLIVATLVLVNTQSDSGLFWLLGYAVIFGLGAGNWSATVPLIVTKLMGVAYFGAIWGIVFAFRTVGDIAGVPGIAALAGVNGYQSAFLVALVLFAATTAIIWLARKPAPAPAEQPAELAPQNC
jgi:MFS family permease